MQTVREIVELALALRKEANMKIRQPLAATAVNQKLEEWQKKLICEELNVLMVDSKAKKFPEDDWAKKSHGPLTVYLDTKLTDELREQGRLRDFLRHVNDIRKLARLSVNDTIILHIAADDQLKAFINEHAAEINQVAKISRITWEIPATAEVRREVKFEGSKLQIGLTRTK